VFGCARVVFNDGLRAREAAHQDGEPYISDGELSRRLITEAKRTPEREWLAGVSAVVLQQALADLSAAYRNFFDSVSGKRKGPKVGGPRFRSRKDRRHPVHCECPVEDHAGREAAPAEDRGRAGPLVPRPAV
jgi:putative transposase